MFSHFSDGDFRLGLNATQTTLGAIAQLTGAKVKSSKKLASQKHRLRSRLGKSAVSLGHSTLFWFGPRRYPVIRVPSLRANIDETVLPVIITEQGENRNQCEEQRYIFGFSHGFACR